MIPVIDMHCDTIASISDAERAGKKKSLRQNDGHVDLLRMKQADYMCQSFALFTYLPTVKETGLTPYGYFCRLSDLFDREMAANADLIRPVTTASEIEQNFREGFLSALKTVEEGAVMEGSLENLRDAYARGVRKMTLTWNFENELGFPNRKTDRGTEADFENGLKPAGKEMVRAMEEMGVIIDVSHLNDAGIRGIFSLVGKHTPVIASHSDCRALAKHPRNLTDENIRLIAEHGGVAGINFCGIFLNDNSPDYASIADMVRHAAHMKKIGSIDIVALGSDYDGVGNAIELQDCSSMQTLADALSLAGFTTDEIEKIFYRNALRAYKEVLG